MTTVAFWRAAAERSARTICQTAISIVGVDAVTSVVDIDWPYIAGVSATAGILSLLTSVAASNVGDPGPSFGQEVETL